LEKAQALHDKVMKLLIRRYVTAEQRRRLTELELKWAIIEANALHEIVFRASFRNFHIRLSPKTSKEKKLSEIKFFNEFLP